MKVLIVNTDQPHLRSDIRGWSSEDSDLYVPGGVTPESDENLGCETILEALAKGWRLLGPPQKVVKKVFDWVSYIGGGEEHSTPSETIYYVWWLTKD